MKRKLTLLVVVLMALLLGHQTIAQISEKGTPASFAFKNDIKIRAAAAPFKTPIQFNVAELKAEDKIAEANNTPLRTAIIIPVEIDAKHDGEWTTLPSGQQIWRLTIQAPDAIAIMLYYDEFVIPEGGKLFVYNEDESHIIGAYTSKTNPTDGAFATEFVAGDKITLEYNAPFESSVASPGDIQVIYKYPAPKIKISGIGYGYNYLRINRTQNMLKIGESDACEVNINCPEGNDWQDQKKGVAKTITPIGGSSFLCSGTLINNTAQDMTPFFLTASHCIWDGTTTVSASGMSQIMYYFHYESPTCATDLPVAQRTIVGAQLLVDLPLDGSSDGVLYRLNSSIPLDWDLYFNGWDRRNIAATSGVGIHHPSGDVMKISTFTGPVSSAQFSDGGTIGALNAHWNFAFTSTANGHGITEGGSSGSPMFNQDGRVVGTLTGGNSSCDNLNGTNLYGKLWYHWDNVTSINPRVVDVTKTMSYYLDPLSTGQETLNGTYTLNNLPTANFTSSSTNIYAIESIEYTDYSVGATSWQWTFQGGTPATYTGKTPPPIRYNSVGSFTTTLEINGGAGPQETMTENITVTIKGTPAIPVADFAVPDLVYSEGFEVASTWSSDWTVDNKSGHVSPNSWTRGNFSQNFNSIDPLSTASACINWHHDMSDTWLITNHSFPIVQGSSIEFYALYDGNYLNHTQMNFLVSDDGGTTWTQLWTTGNTVAAFAHRWERNTFDLSAYDGQNLMFAWQYVGEDGYYMAIDGIKLFDPATSVTLNVGDYLTPIDLSTGPPVLWDWTFNGATPVNATDEAPRVQYMTAGVYDISLTVENTVGIDSKTLTSAVTVVDQTPVTAFKSEAPGYTMQENYGPYMVPGNAVNFIDLTTNYPLSWSWTFDGGSPANSTAQNPSDITYNAAGLYDVTLIAENTAGSQTKVETGYVKVGYDSPTRIWNMSYGEPITSYSSGAAAAFGSNTNNITMFSERFEAPMSAGYVSAVDIKCFKTAASNGDMTVSLFTDNSGFPGTQFATATIDVSINGDIPTGTSVTDAQYVTATFPSPVLVSGPFHIVISGLNSNNTGSTGRYVYIATSTSRGDLGKNTANIYRNSAWQTANSLYDQNLSMDIVPYFEYTTFIEAGFEAEYKGYIRQANYGRFIPTGETLNFFDRSGGVPVDWNWTFSGGTPNTSNDANPLQISYNTPGNHTVKLEVSNSAGATDYMEISDYVRAAYDADDRIWNMLPGELGDQLYTSGSEYVTGTNTYLDIAYAERFDAPLASGYIYGVDLMLESIGGSGTLEVSIRKDENGLPGQILTIETLSVGSIASGGYTHVQFTNDAYTDGAFFVVVSGFDMLSGDVVIYSSNLLPPSAKNTAYVLDALNDWYPVLEPYTLDNSLSLNIAPLFTYHLLSFSVDPASSGFTTSDLSVTRQDIDSKEDTLRITSDIPWTATSTASWVTITNGAATGDDEFWFSVTDNTTPYPRVAKIIVAPTGLDKLQQIVTIRQASTYPAGLTAAFDSNGDVQIDWTAMPLSAPAPVTIKPTPHDVSLKSSSVKREVSGDLLSAGSAINASRLTTENATNVSLRPQAKDFAPTNTRSLLKAAPAETVIRWDDGSNANAIGMGSGQNCKLEAATLFTAADMTAQLLPSGISKITEVEVYINDLPVNGITLKIRQGSIVYYQEVPNSQLMSYSFNTIVLNEPFVLDKVSDTYIGYEFYCNGGMYVAGIDAGPGVAGKGDLISEQGGPLQSLTSLGFTNANWNIAAKIETGRADNYVLYRDGVELTRTIIPTATPSYLDTDNLSFGEHCYGIAALFDDLESTPSPDVCVFNLSPENSMFTVTPNSLQFDTDGDNLDITITLNDPSGYISTYSLNFYDDLPGWLSGPTITPTLTGYTYTYTAAANTTGTILAGDIHIWLSASGSSTYTTNNGYAIPVSQSPEMSPSLFDYDLSNRSYNGLPQTVSVELNSALTGLGAITVLYDGSSSAPVDAGTYVVSIDALAGANFDAITDLVLGSLTIDKAVLSAGLLDYTIANSVYSNLAQPVIVTLKAPYTGLGNITVLYNGSATDPVNAGVYSIAVNALGGTNFDAIIGLALGAITIDPAPLTIRPNNASRPYGEVNPSFGVVYTGLLGTDVPSSITNLSVTTTATISSLPGVYPITASGAQNSNYDIQYTDGQLTVEYMIQTIDFPSLPTLYIGDEYQATATSSAGLDVTFTSDNPSIASVSSTGIISANAIGTATITASNNGDMLYGHASTTNTVVVMGSTGSEWIDVSQLITVYPNPIPKFTPVYVKADVDEALLTDAVITVFTESGLLVKNTKVTGKLTKVDLFVDAGTYLFVIKGKDSFIKTLKVIVK